MTEADENENDLGATWVHVVRKLQALPWEERRRVLHALYQWFAPQYDPKPYAEESTETGDVNQ